MYYFLKAFITVLYIVLKLITINWTLKGVQLLVVHLFWLIFIYQQGESIPSFQDGFENCITLTYPSTFFYFLFSMQDLYFLCNSLFVPVGPPPSAKNTPFGVSFALGGGGGSRTHVRNRILAHVYERSLLIKIPSQTPQQTELFKK